MSMKWEEEAGNARDAHHQQEEELKPPGQACRCGQPSFTGQQSTGDICHPRVKSSPIPVVSLNIGSQPSNSTWHHLHLLIISSDQTGPKAYIAGHHVKC